MNLRRYARNDNSFHRENNKMIFNPREAVGSSHLAP